MIGYIKGIIDEIGIDYILIENNGIGYKLLVSTTTLSQLSIGQEAKIYTKMIVREDDISLCGFYSKEEEEMFKLLTSVSKVGTKVGMGILSFAPPARIQAIIINSDVTAMSKAPGVGKKTAERIILELKDKVGKIVIDGLDTMENLPLSGKEIAIDNSEDEAISALIALGYTSSEAQESVNFVKQPGMDVEVIIKKALEYIMKTSLKF
ncbi:MAG: Holliday junction branch migration protein RuvA [Peptostreptococcus sp.]|uniref:Holliday junction branch migration complex subunit RuvA n=1 Tax=Peptostreptococcus anaerobius TaxID=1261 RepID=A0A379CF72_9FIRM|nr:MULTISPECIES: Holliday junction branch migration protein RuvA [Peptostreptococcus]EKX90018.1 Holliday junction DNA helicase RuvA [Peptostreptococcus anaerobius VPI 4330 = DSM 2949]KXB73032.1 Holliday junction DNA helicase RuvA [Peptostreptococcus anaerobius]MBS5596997.1 Holliday junction branch migration protein RuvA [Peptostreptococcus sp.]MCB6982140.1 Holliday junction branch migration protein RuvA [Peptostreptococcus anaerobius]MCQ5149863.1 Holliday junction branch migration protein RuvA